MKEAAPPIVVPIIAFLGFLIGGIFATFYPAVVQRHSATKFATKWSPILRIGFVQRYIQSKYHRWELRFYGVLSLAAAAFLLYVLLTWPPEFSR